jgi:ATP-dependent RNA helicase DeaD
MGADRDLQITSQTGSGKTVALGFVMSTQLLAKGPRGRGPSTLVIAPTRELAAQVKEELQWLFAEVRDITLEVVTGGTSIGAERFRLARKPVVVVGTPGRLLDHITNGALDVSGVTQLVLDEADQMLDMGFRDELDGILATMPPERRTHLVSATFPPQVLALTQRYQQDALHIAGTAHGEAHADIEHVAHPVGPRERYAALVNLLLLAGEERTLLFVRTRQDTTGLADKLSGDGFAALPISGDLAQAQRTRTLAAFRRGTVRTLVATDVAARGLDIPNVTMVVHVDPPIDPETYTHRAGRTGRAGQKGRSIMLVPRPRERAIRRLLNLAKVDVQWQPVPNADQVRARQIERLGARVQQELAESKPCAAQRALADQLLHDKSPQDVVAGLLAAMSQEQTREPFPFGATGATFAATSKPAPAPAAPKARPCPKQTRRLRFPLPSRSNQSPSLLRRHRRPAPPCRAAAAVRHQHGNSKRHRHPNLSLPRTDASRASGSTGVACTAPRSSASWRTSVAAPTSRATTSAPSTCSCTSARLTWLANTPMSLRAA